MSGRLHRSQAALEFALVMPILLLLIFGVLDAGRVVVAAISLNNAAREGARFATLDLSNGACPSTCQSDVRAVVTNAALGLDTTQIRPFTVTVSAQNVVGVALSYPFSAATPLVGSALGGINVTANSTMLAR